MSEPAVAEQGECLACGGLAELEEEDGCRKWVCQDDECGYEFHVEQIMAKFQDACSLGIPESTRQMLARIQERLEPGVLIAPPTIPVRRPE